MHDAPSALSAWSNFYVIVGSSAGALTGLMFVVITLVASVRSRSSEYGISTFSSPTVGHFCVALFVSAILAAPWPSLVYPSTLLALTGLYGIGYALLVLYRMRTRLGKVYRPQVEDWVWYAFVPLIAYVTIVGAAIRLAAAPGGALFALAGATILLVFLGIHNAWDVVTFIALSPDAGEEAEEHAAAATTSAPAPHDTRPG